MKRSARLEKIADINLGFENLAGASLSATRSQFEAQENQLEQLKIYKGEYQNQLKSRLKETITAKEMQDYQYFFSSLDNAIAQQEESVKQSALQVEVSEQNWLDKKQDHSKMVRAAENLKSREDSLQQKKEQTESDELNLRMYTAKNTH